MLTDCVTTGGCTKPIMLVSWDQEFIADKNKIFKYGSIKLVIRFQKLDAGTVVYFNALPQHFL